MAGCLPTTEASLAASLDLAVPEDVALLRVIEATLDQWAQPQQGICYALTAEFIAQLVASRLVLSEADLAAAQQARAPAPAPAPPDRGAANAGGQPAAPPPLFITVAVPRPPALARGEAAPIEPEDEAEAAELPSVTVLPPPGIVAAQVGGVSCFVIMTLQNTDVGVGQKLKGKARRSPEVFIPLAALDQHPDFWTFPAQFTADVAGNKANPRKRRNRLGKMDRDKIDQIKRYTSPQTAKSAEPRR